MPLRANTTPWDKKKESALLALSGGEGACILNLIQDTYCTSVVFAYRDQISICSLDDGRIHVITPTMSMNKTLEENLLAF